MLNIEHFTCTGSGFKAPEYPRDTEEGNAKKPQEQVIVHVLSESLPILLIWRCMTPISQFSLFQSSPRSWYLPRFLLHCSSLHGNGLLPSRATSRKTVDLCSNSIFSSPCRPALCGEITWTGFCRITRQRACPCVKTRRRLSRVNEE